MKPNSMIVEALAVILVGILPLNASANEELAKKRACVACHQADKKIVGPSWSSIREKYKGSVTSAQLAKSIKAGGSGKWGPIPMPPQGTVSEEDALTLATWILDER